MDSRTCLVIENVLGLEHINLINDRLFEYLNQVDMFCQNAGGRLVSRQAIACAIVSWQANNPDEKLFKTTTY